MGVQPVRRLMRRARWPVAIGLSIALGAAIWVPLSPIRTLSIRLPSLAQSVAISGDGGTVLTESHEDGDYDSRTIRFWDRHSGELRATFPPIPKVVDPVRLSPDGSLAAILVRDAPPDGAAGPFRVCVWRATTRSEVARFPAKQGRHFGNPSFRFSPDGASLAFTSSKNDKPAVMLVGIPELRVRNTFEGQCGPLTYSPDGRTLATWTADPPLRPRLWDVATGTEKVVLDSPRIPWKDELTINPNVPHFAFSADGRSLGTLAPVSVKDDRTAVERGIEMFGGWTPDIGAGSLRGTVQERVLEPARAKIPKPADQSNQQEPPAKLVRVWDMATGRLRAERLWPRVSTISEDGWLPGPDESDLSWDAVVVMDDRETGSERLLDPATGDEVDAIAVEGVRPGLSMPVFPCYTLRSSARGDLIAVNQSHATPPAGTWRDRVVQFFTRSKPPIFSVMAIGDSVNLYNRRSKRFVTGIEGQWLECFSPDGRAFVTSPDLGQTIEIWDLTGHRPWLLIIGFAAAPLVVAGLLGRPWRRIMAA